MNYIKENIRFSLAIFANVIALCASVWWLIASNFNTGSNIEIEPIVTSLALTATLLGLNFVNDKLSKPHLKLKMEMAMTVNPVSGERLDGISLTAPRKSRVACPRVG